MFLPSDPICQELKGGSSFALLKVTPEEAVPPDEIISFCELFRDKFTQTAYWQEVTYVRVRRA
jgi:hypothetical protein